MTSDESETVRLAAAVGLGKTGGGVSKDEILDRLVDLWRERLAATDIRAGRYTRVCDVAYEELARIAQQFASLGP